MYAYDSHARRQTIPPGALYLGIAGVLPFWLSTMLLWSHVDPVGHSRAAAVTIAYGALILSFLGGIRWGVAITPHKVTARTTTLVLSVLPCLAGFAAMFLPVIMGLSVLICGFLLHALWDVVTADNGRLPQWFATLRMMLTALVVPAILLVMVRLVIVSLA